MKFLFVVGAQRSGTTYLYHLLDEHPQICMAKPIRPEPKFFLNAELLRKGRDFYEKEFFAEKSSGLLYFGEKSTSYLEIETAAVNIYKYYPNARIIIILRNPILRAWSNYNFSVQNGFEDLSFSAALERETERLKDVNYNTSVNPFAYQTRGHYIKYIEAYLKIFNKHNINILVLEELVGNEQEVKNLYRWLDVNNNFIPSSLKKVLNSSFTQDDLPVDILKKMIPKYVESVEALEAYLGRRLNAWRNYWSIL